MHICDHFYDCVYTSGLGTLRTSQHNIFNSVKFSQIFTVPLMGFEPRVLDLELNALPIEPPHHPFKPQHMLGDVAQWLVRRNSNPKTLGSIPWRGRVRDSFSVSPSQLLCRLVCA